VGGTVTVGNSLTISSLPALSAGTAQIGSVTASISGTVPISIYSVTIGNCITIGSCVTHGVTIANSSVTVNGTFFQGTQPVSLTTLPALVAGTAQIGSVTISELPNVKIQGIYSGGGGEYRNVEVSEQGAVYAILGEALPGGTNQIGSVTASISGTVPISISSVTVGNSVTIASLPAISGTVTANTFALQGTAVTTSNFTSTTASTVLANYNATREVLTIFNEGAGNLHVSVGATCTTVQYQVRLGAGDYYEVPNHQTTITHSAVYATAGTARVCQVS
jgi:hypothetical protein